MYKGQKTIFRRAVLIKIFNFQELINGELPEYNDKPEAWKFGKFVGRGPEKYYLYEIISNKESGKIKDMT